MAPTRRVITASRVRRLVAPEPGERILELHPETDYYALSAAGRLLTSGVLHAR